MPEVERVDAYTGKFYFDDDEEAIEWCEETSFITDEEAEEIRGIVENRNSVRNIKIHFDVPPDLWTGYCEEEPQDVQDVLQRVEEDKGSPVLS